MFIYRITIHCDKGQFGADWRTAKPTDGNLPGRHLSCTALPGSQRLVKCRAERFSSALQLGPPWARGHCCCTYLYVHTDLYTFKIDRRPVFSGIPTAIRLRVLDMTSQGRRLTIVSGVPSEGTCPRVPLPSGMRRNIRWPARRGEAR